MTQKIIGLVGPAGCGKSTAAIELTNLASVDFTRKRFAGPLKDMLRAFGLTEAQVDGDQKEVPCDILGGQTPRHAMQTLGTEWGRELIATDIWARAWTASIDGLGDVVVDDCRFPNEEELIRSMGGKIIRIERAGFGHASTHESEAHVLTADATVINDNTPRVLALNVRDAIMGLY